VKPRVSHEPFLKKAHIKLKKHGYNIYVMPIFVKVRRKLNAFLNKFFKKKKKLKIGIYGPVNSGKTTLANRICLDWLGKELGTVSEIPHETRGIQMMEHVKIDKSGKSLTFNLIDTPGIATKIDFEDFVKVGLKKSESKIRAKEATKGVIEAIKWLDDMDMVLVVMDSTQDPLNQVNVTILGNLDARGIPFLIVSNKIDLKESKTASIREVFPKYDIIGISAKTGNNMEEFYDRLIQNSRWT
jgi:GTP-binding protein Era